MMFGRHDVGYLHREMVLTLVLELSLISLGSNFKSEVHGTQNNKSLNNTLCYVVENSQVNLNLCSIIWYARSATGVTLLARTARRGVLEASECRDLTMNGRRRGNLKILYQVSI